MYFQGFFIKIHNLNLKPIFKSQKKSLFFQPKIDLSQLWSLGCELWIHAADTIEEINLKVPL